MLFRGRRINIKTYFHDCGSCRQRVKVFTLITGTTLWLFVIGFNLSIKSFINNESIAFAIINASCGCAGDDLAAVAKDIHSHFQDKSYFTKSNW